jgi:hypothetical protein
MSESRLMQVMNGAWKSGMMKLKWNRDVEDMAGFMKLAMNDGCSFDDAWRMIFAQRFAAGARYGKASVFRECERCNKIYCPPRPGTQSMMPLACNASSVTA